MIAAIACIGAFFAAAPALIRLWRGPTLHDRAVASYVIAASLAVALAAVGVAYASDALVVAAIIVVLGQIVVIAALLKAARRRSFQPALAALSQQPREGA